MCGISGLYEYQGNQAADGQLLARMLHTIQHRGPDDEGIYQEATLAMGMRRLSIIDLAGGNQPIANEDGQVIVIFNGEIYNYRELTQQLEQAGHHFSTASDTEVIVHLYEEYGEDCVQHLRGMFAFAVWDKRRCQLLLARDRLGIKPLYYTEVDGCLLFGSEIKSLLQHPGVRASLNVAGLNHYLALRYTPAPQTFFANIYALPPGHLLTCDADGVDVRRYWDLQFANTYDPARTEMSYAEELAGLLRESVRLHVQSDVPFGAFLSGGIDSSLIVALMSELLDEPVRTFSVGFRSVGQQTDELPYARQVAARYQTEHHEILTTAQDFIDQAEAIIWHLDQPIADQATVATYLVSKLARQHVKMVLTGEGGDELFAGYARYAGEQWSPWFSHLPKVAQRAAWQISQRLPGLRREKLALYALTQPSEVARLVNWFPLFNPEMRALLCTSTFDGGLTEASTEELFANYLTQTQATAPVNRMLYTDTKLWLPDYLLLRGDKLTMAASIEARVPLLDHKLVEFAAALPPHLKLKGGVRKYLLKQVSRTWLPASIIERKKAGFPIPIAQWFRQEARAFLYDLLAPAILRRRGLFEAGYVQQLLHEHDSGFADHGTLLWGLASVELWHRQFIDQAPQLAPSAVPTVVLNRSNSVVNNQANPE